jgi:predicted thioesterase
VVAADSAGEIGSGSHTRVIIDGEKFMERVRGRCII